ncbi:MAG: transposase [Candidatus Aminicenantia bacterium]
MARPLRIEFPNAFYHITSRGNEKRVIFKDNRDREKMVTYLKESKEKFSIIIYCYVLMDNHFHLLIETAKPNLSKVMHWILTGYTVYFNKRHRRTGHLFQGRYKSLLVDKVNYLLELSRYIHLNPVRAKITEKPENYLWSSYREYIGLRKSSIANSKWLLKEFSSKAKEASKRYKEFVEEGIKTELSDPKKQSFAQAILGKEEFVKKVKKIMKVKENREEISYLKDIIREKKVEEIIKEIARYFRTSEEKLKKGRRGDIRRDIAIYLLRRYADITLKEIAGVFKIGHFSTITHIARKIEERIRKDKKIRKAVEEIAREIENEN